MPPVSVLAIGSLLLLAPQASVLGQGSPSTPLGVVAALQAAGLRRDVATLERLYAPDYFHTNPDGSVMRRAEVLASYTAAAATTFSAADTSEQRVVGREDLAVISERVALHGKTSEGYPFISSYRVTYVLARQGTDWRVVNSHASLLGIDKNPPAGQ